MPHETRVRSCGPDRTGGLLDPRARGRLVYRGRFSCDWRRLGGDTRVASRLDLQWEKWGRVDPYFGVLSAERYRADRLDAQVRTEFFESGERHVSNCFEMMRQHLSPSFAPARALDFGCGVGRLVMPLARRCAEVVGVDVSPGMLAEAARNCEAAGLRNVTLVPSDDALSRVPGTFDFIHSFIVLQHIPARRGERIIRGLLERLDPGGFAMLHVTVGRDTPALRRWLHRLSWSVPGARALVNVLRRRPSGDPLMLMDYYDPRRILAIMHDHGCDHAYVRRTKHGDAIGLMVFTEKRPVEIL